VRRRGDAGPNQNRIHEASQENVSRDSQVAKEAPAAPRRRRKRARAKKRAPAAPRRRRKRARAKKRAPATQLESAVVETAP
jgi:hypothetical protein